MDHLKIAYAVLFSAPKPRFVYDRALKRSTDERLADSVTGQPISSAEALVVSPVGYVRGSVVIPDALVNHDCVPGAALELTGDPLDFGLRGGDFGRVDVSVAAVTGLVVRGHVRSLFEGNAKPSAPAPAPAAAKA